MVPACGLHNNCATRHHALTFDTLRRGDYAPPTHPTLAIVGPHNWKMIATDYLGDQRSDVQCLHRWQKVLQPGLVKGPWTKVR